MSDSNRQWNFFYTDYLISRSYNYCLKHAAGIIFKSGIPDDITRKFCYYVPNGVDTNFFREIPKNYCKRKLNLSLNRKYILFVSATNLHRKEKRYDRFQQVMKILREKYILQDIEELTLVKADRKDVPFFFNASDVVLLVSDVEGSPNSVKEALACNTKVVATNVGNVEKMLSALDGCYVVDSFDPIHIAEKLYECLNSKATNVRKRIFEQNLDQLSVGRKLVSIYEQILLDKY